VTEQCVSIIIIIFFFPSLQALSSPHVILPFLWSLDLTRALMTQSAVDGYYEAHLSWCVLPLYFVRERRIGGMSNSSSSFSPLSIIFEELFQPEIRSFFCLVGILCV
jgi:hypothetical protein